MVRCSAPRCSNRVKFKSVFFAALSGAPVYFSSVFVFLTIANLPWPCVQNNHLEQRRLLNRSPVYPLAGAHHLDGLLSLVILVKLMRLVSMPFSSAYYHQKLLCRLFSTRGWELESFRACQKKVAVRTKFETCPL